MATKYTITALDRTSMGHPNYHQAHRAWPSGQDVVVEVLDQDDDPMVIGKGSDGEMHTYPDPLRVGRESFARLQADKMLMIRLVGGSPEEAETQQKQIAELQHTLATATMRAELAESELLKVRAEAQDLAGEVSTLTVRSRELEQQLDEATAPKSKKQK